jgi:hypothetical protein
MEIKSPVRNKTKATLIGAICLLPLLVLAGCASQYDCYECGRVGCSYCPPKPLPNSAFQSCNCTDSIGQIYAANLLAANNFAMMPANYSEPNYIISSPDENDASDSLKDKYLNGKPGENSK